jgi:hypothetical protein
LELHNPQASPVNLAGWELSGGIRYTFDAGVILAPGEYLVVAKQPARLKALPAYALGSTRVLGPYAAQLSNRGETLRLRDATSRVVDSVSYSAEFPWAISADALGANEEWTGLRPEDFQYRGRSLERVSMDWPSNDPANWLASPIPGNPSPGRPNSVQRATPKPVVIRFSATQLSNESALIRANEAVLVQCQLSGVQGVSELSLEWFVDDIEVQNESAQTVALLPEPGSEPGRFRVTLPGQPNRTLVRYRFRGNRGTGEEVISPRADDPFAWHAYFVTPTRSSSRPSYDCLISSASMNILQANISQNPRRVTSPDPPGTPRASWNATEPAVMVHEGVVYDIRMRHHGSRYNRNANRNSFKWQFPRYRKFQGVTGIFETDKGNDFIVGHGLFRAAGVPMSAVRYVDVYLNSRSVMQRLEQGEFDGDMLEEYHLTQQALNPGSALEPAGEIYKNVGTIDMNGEGPYGRGDGRKLSKPPYWSDLQMYDWTFALQNHGWRGSYYWKEMIDAFWVARGDTPTRLNPNVPALRTFFAQHFDIDAMLTYIALENWCCPWDDTTQNHFFWQRRNGKWSMLPWDCDAWFGRGDNTPPSASIYMGEVGDPNNNFRGPNFFKDGFIKAYREELKQRLFVLNNTFLHPDNLTALGFGSIRSFAQARMDSVNQQCGFGAFQRPNKPVALSPKGGITALPPGLLSVSSYRHSGSPARPHAATTWEIRSASGSYVAPLWKMRSTTNLSSISVPFHLLRFGESYFWRATYEDADGHPSVSSDEASFSFGPSSAQAALLVIDAETLWRYDQSGTDRSTQNWTAASFDDSAWATGACLFAKEEAALPYPIRTPLTLGRSTYYFRKRFDLPGTPQGAVVRLSYVVDDGCIIYLNGKEVTRVRMPGETVGYGTFASQNVGDAVSEGPFEIPASLLQAGANVIAVEVHQSNASSSDVVFGLTLDATLPAGSGTVMLNEIAALNSGSVTNAGSTPDWVELYNNASQTVDLGGYSLSDDPLAPFKYTFPPNTLIPARGYLLVWCDSLTNSPGLHAGFRLNDKGQTVALFGPNSNADQVLDYVTFGLQVADLTIARSTDGAGNWQLSTPTPGLANRVQTLAPSLGLKINEWMAAPNSGDDWLELFNPNPLPAALGGLYLSDDLNNPANTRLSDLSFIAGYGFVKLLADENTASGADHLGFKLSAGGETIALYAGNGSAVIDSVQFGAQAPGVSEGRLPDGAETRASFPSTASPGDPNHLPLQTVVISEVLAHSDPPLEDAIELQNISAATVDLSGWWLSDSRREPLKYRIPAGTVLSPGQFIVFYEEQFGATNMPASFALSSAMGDEVVLSQTDGAGRLTGYRTKVDFGPSEQGVSFGRFPTSVGHDFTTLEGRTFGVDAPSTLEEFRNGSGQSNSAARIGPIVISEIMFRPPNLGTNENYRDEFVELVNTMDQAVTLYDPSNPANPWRIRGGLGYDFPPGLVLPPGGVLVLVSFDPLTDQTARAAFEAVYGPVAQLYGPFSGRLANDEDDVRLLRPDAPDPGLVPYILSDRVQYSAAAPWPNGASGTGASLTKATLRAYGNDPAHWTVTSPSPGRVNGGVGQAWRLAIELDAAGVKLIGNGPANAQVILQSSADLEHWADVNTIAATNGSFAIPLPNTANAPARYYRLLMRP